MHLCNYTLRLVSWRWKQSVLELVGSGVFILSWKQVRFSYENMVLFHAGTADLATIFTTKLSAQSLTTHGTFLGPMLLYTS